MVHTSTIAALYTQYVDQLHAYMLHLGFDEDIAMDSIHDVFCKLCINYSTLGNVSNLKFYLFRALKNRLIDILRTNKEFTGTLSDKKTAMKTCRSN